MRLDGGGLLEHSLEILALDLLQVRVAANVLLVDEDVGHGALARHLGESLLDVITVVLLVQLDGLVLGVVALEDALRVLAVGAV